MRRPLKLRHKQCSWGWQPRDKDNQKQVVNSCAAKNMPAQQKLQDSIQPWQLLSTKRLL